jgi:hypothetical protein
MSKEKESKGYESVKDVNPFKNFTFEDWEVYCNHLENGFSQSIDI